MAKKIFVCFDGTANEPGDADSPDENISNVLKLYLRAGGCLGEPEPWKGQLGLYYKGPGTTGGPITRALVSGLADRALNSIEDRARDEFRRRYEAGDEVSVFGFSRGAAIARRFVSELCTWPGLKASASGPPIRFVGVFDTVLSEGVPQKDSRLRDPKELGESGPLNDKVGSVCHLLSIDDPRLVFTPTLYENELDSRVNEVWFPGVHSDVGGGYRENGLSDFALGFMLERASDNDNLRFMEPEEVPENRATAQVEKGTVRVDSNDLAFSARADAPDHRAEFTEKDLKEIAGALGDRRVASYSGGTPTLHPVFRDRLQALPGYKPENVGAHRLYGSNTTYASAEEHRT